MLARHVLVKVMLGALAVGAAAGVALVFGPNLPQMGRVAATGAVLVVACGMLLFNSEPGPEDRMTLLHRTWASYVGVGAVTALVLTWTNAGMGDRLTAAWFAWMLYGFGGFVAMRPALRSMSRTGVRPLRTSENIMLLGGATAFAVGLAGAAWLGWSERGMAVLWTVIAILAHALMAGGGARALAADAGVPRVPQRDRRLALACIATGAASTLLWVLVILSMWQPLLMGTGGLREPRQEFLTLAMAAATCTLTLAIWCATRALRLTGWASMLPAVSTLFTAAAGAILTFATTNGFSAHVHGELLVRILGAIAILDAAALIAVAVAARAARAADGSGDYVRPIASMHARCPRCTVPTELAPGENACKTCGLVTVIGFRDDRCPGCGYDLRAGDRASCPECGRARQHAGLHAT